MAYKDSLLILITFLNTLLLVTGFFSVYASLYYEICQGTFCYAIRSFTSFYETIFFYYGLLLIGFSSFGFIALFADVKALLESYAKVLIFLLVAITVLFVMGVWGKGSVHLYNNMWTSFKLFGSGSCRLDTSINDLQNRFKCCGIGSARDWTILQKQYQRNITIPPMSCCNSAPFFQLPNEFICQDVYQTGCFTPLHNYTLEFFNTIILIGIFIALNLIIAISCVFRYIELKKLASESSAYEQDDDNDQTNTTVVPAMPFIISQDRFYVKDFQNSTVV